VVADSHGEVGGTVSRVAAIAVVQHLVRHDDSNRLLRVSKVRLNRKKYAVSALITNPYPFAIDTDKADAYAVAYDSSGRIIGGGNAVSLAAGEYGSPSLRPGARERVTIFVAGNLSRLVRVQVSATR